VKETLFVERRAREEEKKRKKRDEAGVRLM
jgi:hypothetical protein